VEPFGPGWISVDTERGDEVTESKSGIVTALEFRSLNGCSNLVVNDSIVLPTRLTLAGTDNPRPVIP
jgi:hypothetical protein